MCPPPFLGFKVVLQPMMAVIKIQHPTSAGIGPTNACLYIAVLEPPKLLSGDLAAILLFAPPSWFGLSVLFMGFVRRILSVPLFLFRELPVPSLLGFRVVLQI